MVAKNYILTSEARRHLRALKANSIKRYGKVRTAEYLQVLHDGLQYAAINPQKLPAKSQERMAMTGETDLMLHHIGRHYVAFKFIDQDTIAIGAILGDTMDIPNRLKELNTMTREEIADMSVKQKNDYN